MKKKNQRIIYELQEDIDCHDKKVLYIQYLNEYIYKKKKQDGVAYIMKMIFCPVLL